VTDDDSQLPLDGARLCIRGH